MKYEQPYGVSDPNASYINGNPSTGTMGSIPPAASIENPQREIVNLIGDAKGTPTDTDLHQLSKGVQSSQLNYAPDTGLQNQVVAAIVPVPDAYLAGMVVRFKAAHGCSGPSTLDAGRGALPIVKQGGVAMVGSEWATGDIITVTNDGVGHWQFPTPASGMLFAPRDYYVNSTTGNDSNDGLTAATPFQTLQKAQNTSQLYNLNGFSITIHIANGTYGPVTCGRINGSGNIIYLGNPSNPTAVQITNTAGPCVVIGGGQMYYLNGISVSATGDAPGFIGAGIDVLTGGAVVVQNVNFGYCIDHHIALEGGAQLSYTGPNITISSGCTNGCHINVLQGSYVRQALVGPNLTITNTASFGGAFIAVSGSSTTFVTYSSITGYANVSGQKFAATENGCILTQGLGVGYYPGTVAGATSTGGQYG